MLPFLVMRNESGWTTLTEQLDAGAHAAILVGEDADLASLEGRLAGLEVRDVIAVLRPGPSISFVLLFRKPLAEQTIIEQVLQTGRGALNVNACRVPSSEPVQTSAGALGGFHGSPTVYAKGTGRVYGTHGRWPSNVVLVHDAECVDGSCCSRCSVVALDQQSGVLHTNPGQIREHHSAVGFHGGGAGSERAVEKSSGGASRFFPQFDDEQELLEWLQRLVMPPI